MEGTPPKSVNMPPPLCFDQEAFEAANEAWGFNAGPAALCALFGLTPEQVRPHLGTFVLRGYASPSVVIAALRSLGAEGRVTRDLNNRTPELPHFGIARIQWDGPWTNEGMRRQARYPHTHWVAAWRNSLGDEAKVFDVHALAAGGWVSLFWWKTKVVPWVQSQLEPMCTGGWWVTHSIEVDLLRL